MQRFKLSISIIAFFVNSIVLTAQVSITPPTVIQGGLTDPQVDAINDALIAVSTSMEANINTEINPYINQDSLVMGFANAGATTSHIGTQRLYNDYKAFSLTLGTGFVLSAPSLDPALIEQAVSKIETEGDLYFGVATQPISASLGINMGWLAEGLYGTVKVGYANLSEGTMTESFSFTTLTLGTLFHYQLIESKSLPLGFLRWRGLSVGSGLIYQSNESIFKMNFPIDPIEFTEPTSGLTADLTLEPVLTIGVTSSSVTIPLEATTGFRLFWLLDIAVGAGVDVAFGDSKIDLSLNSPVNVQEKSGLNLQFNEGSAEVDAGTTGTGPQLIRPRLTADLGLNLGPVKLTVPMMYYFEEEGISALVGVNLGIVW